LAESHSYDVFAVKYGATFNHVMAIRRGEGRTRAAEDLLRRSATLPYITYAHAKSFRKNPWSCRVIKRAASWLGPQALGLPKLPSCRHERDAPGR
jgi:hypothetical protein